MMTWILSRLKWVALIAALAPWGFAYLQYDDAERENLFAREGKDAVALIDGATRITGRRRGTRFEADLTWRDEKGQERKAQKVEISSALADQIFDGNRITRDRIKIRYLPDDPTMATWVSELRRPVARSPVRAVVDMLPLLVSISLVGAGLFFVLWRRGRRAL